MAMPQVMASFSVQAAHRLYDEGFGAYTLLAKGFSQEVLSEAGYSELDLEEASRELALAAKPEGGGSRTASGKIQSIDDANMTRAQMVLTLSTLQTKVSHLESEQERKKLKLQRTIDAAQLKRREWDTE